MSSNLTIYTGFWVNYDAPTAAAGATLTVSTRWGNYLIAALSSLVALAGTRAWFILSYILHQKFAAQSKKDALDLQLQVMLRGPPSIFDALFDSVSLYRAWKGNVTRLRRRTWSLAVLAVVFFSLFAAAGIFVAEVASRYYQDVLVLVQPLDCGDYNFLDNAGEPGSGIPGTADYQQKAWRWAREYASAAYNDTGGDFSGALFSKPTIPFASSPAACPWTVNTTCLGPNQTVGDAWMMDTGMLNSHIHFGINAPAGDRIDFRKSTTCAVLDARNLTGPPTPSNDTIFNTTVLNTYVGVMVQYPILNDTSFYLDDTFEININWKYQDMGYFVKRANFFLNSEDIYTTFNPTFNSTESDVSVHVVVQTLQTYLWRVDDPLYMAHSRDDGGLWAPQDADQTDDNWYPSNLVSILACNDQFQMCNPGNDQCSKLTGKDGVGGMMDVARKNILGFNNAQWATARRIAAGAAFVGPLGVNSAIANAGLITQDYGYATTFSPLPDDQWVSEVQLWFATSLSNMQKEHLQWAVKPWAEAGHPSAAYASINLTALDEGYQAAKLESEYNNMCGNQLIRSTNAVQNFNVVPTVLVIVICLAITITATTLPCCVGGTRNRIKKRAPLGLSEKAKAREIALVADDKYQLLRMALESSGVTGWKKGKSGLPISQESISDYDVEEADGLAWYSKVISDASKLGGEPNIRAGSCRRPSEEPSTRTSQSVREGEDVQTVHIVLSPLKGTLPRNDSMASSSAGDSLAMLSPSATIVAATPTLTKSFSLDTEDDRDPAHSHPERTGVSGTDQTGSP